MHELAWVWRRCRSIATTGGVHRVQPAQGAPAEKSASPGSASRLEGDSVAPHAAHTRVFVGSSAGCVPPCQPCRECVNSTADAVTVIAHGVIRPSCLRGRCLVGRGEEAASRNLGASPASAHSRFERRSRAAGVSARRWSNVGVERRRTPATPRGANGTTQLRSAFGAASAPPSQAHRRPIRPAYAPRRAALSRVGDTPRVREPAGRAPCAGARASRRPAATFSSGRFTPETSAGRATFRALNRPPGRLGQAASVGPSEVGIAFA